MQTDTELLQQQIRCIAHEIRNQVSVCDVYCEIIKKHLEKENIENDSINKALNCIQKSAKMINNSLIDLKSVDNIKPQVCDLKRIIEECSSLAKVYIHDKKINIISNIKEDASIYVDENKFMACIINLMKNAVEAIENKGEIIISSEIKDGNVIISVANDGKAITPAAQRDLFSEGFTTKRTGSGLGLFICKNNLKQQDADLYLVQSTAKKTEFQIKVPVLK